MAESQVAESANPLRVCAIIVAYFPEIPLLEKLLEAAFPQVKGIVVVDNTPKSPEKTPLAEAIKRKGITWVEKGTNVGLGAAQNVGIGWAKTNEFSHVLLLDQDSVPGREMVGRLAQALNSLENKGIKVSAVGARVINNHTQREMWFVKFGWFRVQKIFCGDSEKEPSIPVDHLIASGCLISIAALDEIGWMDESFFIDYIDTDWHLRAKSKGFQSYGVCDAILYHGLAEGIFRIWLGFWQYPPKQEVSRYYFIFRNSMVLRKRKYATLKWKIIEWGRLARTFLFYSVCVPPRGRNALMMLKGFWHGLRGKSGPLEE